jgi:hypothetical protein
MHQIEISPRSLCRIAGLLYLIIIVAGLGDEMFIRNALIASGDAAATAHNIAAAPFLWRLGIAGDLLMHLCDVPLMLILYILLKPVNKHLALLAMLFTFVQTSVLVATKLNAFTPLFLLGDAAYLHAFDAAQLQALSYVAIRADSHGFGFGLMFFGCTCLLEGYLIFRSGYLPKVIGVLMQLAGLCYLTNSFALILSPALAGALFPAILLPAFVGESSLCLWLLLKGVNTARWIERNAAA